MFLLQAKESHHVSQLKKERKEGKDQESIQSSTTPDPRHHLGKCQEANHSPAGFDKVARNRQDSMIKTNVKYN